MERLRSLIKEVLTVKPKEDCNCGCGGCAKKSPIITEGRIKKAISEGLTYHVENKIPLHESVYRIGSEKHFALINEARKLWVRGLIDVSEDDQAILETHLGNFGMYEGEKVPLDMPMVNEEKKLTYNNFIQMVRDDMMAGAAPDEYPSDERVRKDAKYLYNRYLQGDSVDDLFEESLNEEKAITFKPGTLSDMELATKILDKEGIEYKIDNFDLILSDEDYLVVLDYLKGGNNVNVNLSTSILNEDEAAFEYNKARAGRIIKDLFGPDFEFDYTYKLEGDRIIIHPEGYNPDGTLFDMKDVHKEKIIRTFRDKMPKAQATPNNGGGITVNLKESLDEELEKDYIEHLQNVRNDFYNKGDKEKAAEVQADIDKLLGKSLDEAKKKKKKKKEKKDPPLGKPKRGGSKAYYVYVRDPKTKKIKKVSFGSGGLRAKIKNAEARKRFAARHNCKNKKDRTTAGYWSCNLPRYAEQLGLGSKMNTFW
tara:strand:+ start:8136 stop:9578 length:1443 start_codon:yes stop_codon:yes gene_type:complete